MYVVGVRLQCLSCTVPTQFGTAATARLFLSPCRLVQQVLQTQLLEASQSETSKLHCNTLVDAVSEATSFDSGEKVPIFRPSYNGHHQNALSSSQPKSSVVHILYIRPLCSPHMSAKKHVDVSVSVCACVCANNCMSRMEEHLMKPKLLIGNMID
ncbi:unnamed protein product [Protopolystoma xenopodis]|uniref:Uncharacterized protein n=1 Tax=Protopolystoma xenopodis TaxID=117903 RepID=A0A3S5B8E9_9PLAT|nr:unnamed protein product [Protopolystoma xenopodis]